MIKKLRLKFICINMLTAFVMLCVIFSMIFGFTRQNLETESLRMMEKIAANPLQLGSPDEQADSTRLPYFALQIGLWGEILAISGGYYDLSDRAFLEAVMEAAMAQEQQSGILEDYNLRFCRVVSPASQCLVFADMSSEQTVLSNLGKTCLLLGAVSLLIFFFISLLLARWAVKPAEQAWKQQKQFVADASHELKTPLTVIMTNAELLQDPNQDEQSRAQFSEHILTMTRQMRGLVEGLLELARADNGTARLTFARLDFTQLVSDAVLPFEPLYFERELTLACRLETGLQLWGSELHLRQVLEILLDNALKYAQAPSTVQVTLHRLGSHCLLAVASHGAPISPEDLKNIFKRFYRVEASRTTRGSYGLGLSIAESIVQAHKGKIWAESAGETNTFFVQLPL